MAVYLTLFTASLPEGFIHSHCLWCLGPVHSSSPTNTDMSLRCNHQSYIARPLLTEIFCSPWHYWPLSPWIFSSPDVSIFFPSCFWYFLPSVTLWTHLMFLLSPRTGVSEGSARSALVFTFRICHPWLPPTSYFLSCQTSWKELFQPMFQHLLSAVWVLPPNTIKTTERYTPF